MLPRQSATPVPTSARPAASSTARAKAVATKATVDRPAPIAPKPSPTEVKAAITTAAKATPEATPVTPAPQPTFFYPVAGAKVTQAFGHRPTNQSIRYQSGTNLGTDFAANEGSAINAPINGTVVGVNSGAGSWGNQVIIDAGNGRQISFNHLSGFGKIKKGQVIKAGDVLGQVGHTGQTTGPHLDMEATVNGTSVPLGTAFQGYQFDKAYNGANLTEKGAQGYNRSQNKFYDLNDLTKSTGSVYKYGSGGGSTTPAPTATGGSSASAPSAADSAALRAPGTRFSLGALFGGSNASSAPVGMSSSVPAPASSSSQFKPSMSAPADVSMSSNTDTTAKDTSGKSQEVAPVGRL